MKQLGNVNIFTGNLELNIVSIFTDRELAVGFWACVFIIIAFSNKIIRKSILELINRVLDWKIIIWFITMIIYVVGVVYVLYQLGFWKEAYLKETIFWFFFVGVIISFRAVIEAKDPKFFIRIIKDSIKLNILFQFLINLYSFSLLWEIVIAFVITIASVFVVFIDEKSDKFTESNDKIIRNFFYLILVFIGLIMLFHSTRLFINNFDQINYIELASILFLPVILSFVFIFYLYFLALYSNYQTLFTLLNFYKTIDNGLKKRVKIKVILFCNFNLIRVKNFVKRSRLASCDIREELDIKQLFINYNRYRTELNNDIYSPGKSNIS